MSTATGGTNIGVVLGAVFSVTTAPDVRISTDTYLDEEILPEQGPSS